MSTTEESLCRMRHIVEDMRVLQEAVDSDSKEVRQDARMICEDLRAAAHWLLGELSDQHGCTFEDRNV